MTAHTKLSKDEFCVRFKAHMIKMAGEKFDDGKPIADYADEISPTYFDDQHKHGETPEDCAESDMSYWGED